MVSADLVDGMSASLGQQIQPTFGYYRQPNGWITVSPNTRLERLKYTEEGWEYLEQYGAFDMTPYTANHPFEGLFMFGGAKEMAVEQVIESGLYIDPPLVPRCGQHLTQFHRAHNEVCWRGAKRVEFQQLAGLSTDKIGPFVCEFCKRQMPTKGAREQHQSVAHATPMNNIQLGRSLGDTLAAVLDKPKVTPDDPEKAMMAQHIAELEAEQAKAVERRERMAKARAARKPKTSVA